MSMLIACLGWGSLVWDPRELPVRGIWHQDGPFLPIEFARQSQDGRITLVIVRDEPVPLVRSLWALFSLNDLEEAKAALAAREGIKEVNIKDRIGAWKIGDKVGGNKIVSMIRQWAKSLQIDAVIWTNLPPQFEVSSKLQEGYVPSKEEVVDYLLKKSTPHETRKNAERYIRMTPPQIDTEYRRYVECKLGWKPGEHERRKSGKGSHK